jgi:hypothetical protein
MRRRGLERVARFERTVWRRAFTSAIEQVLEAPARALREQIDIDARAEARTVSVATPSTLVALRVTNRGNQAVLPHGPAGFILRSYLAGDEGWRAGGPEANLPGLLMPGQSVALAIPISVPAAVGDYHVCIRAEHASTVTAEMLPADAGDIARFTLRVVAGDRRESEGCCTPFLEQIQSALGEAHALQRLPEDYTDVSGGRFAALKRWIKRKLLGNFKRAYVDVLSRQQSEFNRHLLTALQELSECCGTLDHAQTAIPARRGEVRAVAPSDPSTSMSPEALRQQLRHLTEQLCETRETLVHLQERLARLETEARQPEAQPRRKDVA